MKYLQIMLLAGGVWLGAIVSDGNVGRGRRKRHGLGLSRSRPDSARPWVYWFSLNGNITREGITADLEAMQRVGIGGVLFMEVDQGAPKGPARVRRAAVARAVQARLRRGAPARPAK